MYRIALNMLLGGRGKALTIIVGKAGTMLKDIGFTVHLFLFVKVKEDWQTSPESLAAMGLEQ